MLFLSALYNLDIFLSAFDDLSTSVKEERHGRQYKWTFLRTTNISRKGKTHSIGNGKCQSACFGPICLTSTATLFLRLWNICFCFENIPLNRQTRIPINVTDTITLFCSEV